MSAAYDEIGIGYHRYRRPDPRIVAAIDQVLGDASSIVNIGAGAGSYEPENRDVVAVEISSEMIRQRAPGCAPCVQADATRLPFADHAFDAALAILTVHHWPDKQAGLMEMKRVARKRAAILTFDPWAPQCWVVSNYFPEILDADRAIFPTLATMESWLGEFEVRPVPVPSDCTDGFLCAYWQRPGMYFDEGARRAISAFARIEGVDAGLARLRADLDSGAWAEGQGALLDQDELDCGYRLIIAELT